VDATFAPHAMRKLDGTIEGFNVDMAMEIGKRLKRPVNIEGTQFSGLIPGLNAKKIRLDRCPHHGDPPACRANAVHRGLPGHRLPVFGEEV